MRRPLNAPPLQNIALALTALCGTAHAQEANTTASGTVATIVVTGSREGTTALKSLAPVQVVDAVALRATGESDLRTALASVSPSYINVISNGGALAKNTRGSSLRGLSGNQVLILVNGKRRHGSSLINNSGGASLGSSAADLGHIPVSAVERVEVLTDGAAAQYGSDAIAGVINVILKSEAVGGAADITYGEYNHSVAKVGDIGDAGRTETANLNKGLELGSNGGFLNLSASVQDTGDSAVLGPWKQPTKPIWQLYAAPGDPREATANRYVWSNVEVVPIQRQASASWNLELPLNEDIKLYSFATYSHRNSRAKGSFRSETNGTANVVTTPGGYGPSLQTIEKDYQLNVGLTGTNLLGWSWDAGLSYGRNRADISVLNTINASFGTLVPLGDLYVGNLDFKETLATANFRRAFTTGLFSEPLRTTVGAEYRFSELALGPGEYYSYAGGGYVFPSDYPAVNLRGTLAGAGSAFLTGFSPQFAFDKDRNNKALFIDLSQQLTPKWQAGLAARVERYSDFGSAVSGKLSNRYEVSPALALRGTVSNGFRAPSLAEQYYSSATVQPTNDPITNTSYISYNYDTVPPDSPAAVALGASKLKAEKSNNISLGAVLTPTASLSASLDVYQIDIKDRIYLTGAFNGFNTPVVANILKAAGLTSSQAVKYFANIGKTRTRGLEAKLDYTAGSTTWGLSYAYNQQKVLSVNTPAALQKAGLSLLGRDRIALLEEALPQHILRGTLGWRIGAWQVDVVESFYSKTRTVNNVLNADQDSVSPNAFITDASVGYRFTKELKATIGSRNLFNKRALDQPAALASTLNYENPYPNQNTPYGFGGAFYYARLNYQW